MLDTQAMLWLIRNSPRLSVVARDWIATPGIELFVSHISGLEVGVKYALGKLPLPEEPEMFLTRHLTLSNLRWLPVSVTSMFAAARLPLHHRDPWDRIIVAQCLRFDLPLISSDVHLDAYGVRRIW
jgi:PIN domain nuclease of toxin-antitoxin system